MSGAMSDTASDAPVLTERRDNVLLITLNRPDQRNAVNGALADGVAAALDTLDGDDALRDRRAHRRRQGLLLRHGPRCVRRRRAAVARRARVRRHRAAPPRKPIIAAIEGFAVAGGLEVALACDLIVAAAGAKLGIPEVKRSLVAAGGALLRLPRRLPSGVAMELALTGDPISAERGFELGLVNRVAEPGDRRRRRDRARGARSRATARSPSRRRRRSSASSGTGPRPTSGTGRARSPGRC